MISKGGVILTDKVCRAYADQAEAGYDVSRLTPRNLT